MTSNVNRRLPRPCTLCLRVRNLRRRSKTYWSTLRLSDTLFYLNRLQRDSHWIRLPMKCIPAPFRASVSGIERPWRDPSEHCSAEHARQPDEQDRRSEIPHQDHHRGVEGVEQR